MSLACSRRALSRALTVVGLLSIAALTATATASASTSSYDPDMFGISVGGTIQWHDPAARDAQLDAIRDVGSRWVRFDIDWSEIQAGGPTSYNWSRQDAVAEAVHARGLKVLAMIAYTPAWARAGGTTKMHPPTNHQDYVDFAAKAAARYSAMGVDTYQVWNEANIRHFWQPAPDPAAYTQMLKAAYAAIKAANPQATVLTAGTAPAATNGTNYSAIDYLAAIYANGGGGSFDAVAHHPYTYIWSAYPGDPSGRGWHQMQDSNPSLRSVMSANGDGAKKIWGTEFGAPTNGPSGVGENAQAEMITKAYSHWRTYEWAGPLLTYSGRDRGTDTGDSENFFGLLRHDFSKKPAYEAYRAVANGSFETVGSTTGSGDTGSGTEAGTEGGDVPATTETGEVGESISIPTTIVVRPKRARRVRGRVSADPVPGLARPAALHGRVRLTLHRRVRGGWRRVGRVRGARLTAAGAFHRRLRTFRRKRLRPGGYRVRARYPGSTGTRPSVARSRRFQVRY